MDLSLRGVHTTITQAALPSKMDGRGGTKEEPVYAGVHALGPLSGGGVHSVATHVGIVRLGVRHGLAALAVVGAHAAGAVAEAVGEPLRGDATGGVLTTPPPATKTRSKNNRQA